MHLLKDENGNLVGHSHEHEHTHTHTYEHSLIPTAMSTAMKRNIPTAMSPRHIPAARDARLTAGTRAMITAMKFLKHRIR